jgi:hypothetical protein
MHWACKYIGLPYEPGARGPEKVDCWGLLFLIYRERFGISLPEHPGLHIGMIQDTMREMKREIREEWEEVPEPFDGAGVALSQRTEIHHVGIFAAADSGKVVHARDFQNVIAEPISALRKKGFKVIKFYRHKLWPS